LIKEVLTIFIRIEPSSPVPIYRQIIDQIRYQIATGALREGDQVPSIRQLADKLAVNQNTILKVYNQLCAEKVLRVERGSGTFVAASRQSIPVAERRKIVAKLLRDAAVQAIHLDVGLEQIKEQLEKEYEAIKLLWKQERSER
jgi:GntR family transcriptional regulator